MIKVLVFLMAMATSGTEPEPATIQGRVVDPSDASMVGIAVQLRNSSNGETIDGVSDANGRYALTGLPPGKYSIQVQAAGFEPFSRDDLMLREGETLILPIALEIRGVWRKV